MDACQASRLLKHCVCCWVPLQEEELQTADAAAAAAQDLLEADAPRVSAARQPAVLQRRSLAVLGVPLRACYSQPSGCQS